jgi:DHA2 family multidrug resistance protein-like MFS transporter
MLGTARLLGQTIGAALVALLLARFPADGTRLSLMVGVGFALVGAMRIRSYTACSSVSETGFFCHLFCVRALRNS